ncbi:hypothetical protein HDU67_002964 [Dinochytrium kinnereticum]|nr:hypothetical protein HDU67_002964 [Dinochytrium kinnereticum]
MFWGPSQSLDVLDGWYVFRKEDQGDEMFIIKKGTVEILDGAGNVLVKLNPGACFGEVALYQDCRRTASARASGRVELCLLKKDEFRKLLKLFPAFSKRVDEITHVHLAREAAAAAANKAAAS